MAAPARYGPETRSAMGPGTLLAGVRAGHPRQKRGSELGDQNLDMVRTKVGPTEPIPVRPSKPGPEVKVTFRVAQLPVPSQ